MGSDNPGQEPDEKTINTLRIQAQALPSRHQTFAVPEERWSFGIPAA